jgi:hypothetical protein
MPPSSLVVLDLWENEGKDKYKDDVKLVNETTKTSNISFKIFGYDQKSTKWELIGEARLNPRGNAAVNSSKWKGKMNEFRWLAVSSSSSNSSNTIKFDAHAMPDNNDILIYIFDPGSGVFVPGIGMITPVFDMQASVVLDLWENEGRDKYKGYVKLINGTIKQNISFNIYGYVNGQWIIIGPKKIGINTDTTVTVEWNAFWGYQVTVIDPDRVYSPWDNRINTFRYIAIHSLDDISFNAQAVVNSNDINIMIIDK